MAKPAQNPDNMVNSVAFSIACWIAGAGIIGAVVYFTVVPFLELLLWALYVLLPLFAIGVGVGLIGMGSFKALTAAINGRSGFGARVKHWVDTLEEDPFAKPAGMAN
jgi:hypothetical protein